MLVFKKAIVGCSWSLIWFCNCPPVHVFTFCVVCIFVENSEDKENWNQKAWEDLVLKVRLLQPLTNQMLLNTLNSHHPTSLFSVPFLSYCQDDPRLSCPFLPHFFGCPYIFLLQSRRSSYSAASTKLLRDSIPWIVLTSNSLWAMLNSTKHFFF